MTLLAIMGLEKIKDRKISTWSSVSNFSSNYCNPLLLLFSYIFTARSRALETFLLLAERSEANKCTTADGSRTT